MASTSSNQSPDATEIDAIWQALDVNGIAYDVREVTESAQHSDIYFKRHAWFLVQISKQSALAPVTSDATDQQLSTRKPPCECSICSQQYRRADQLFTISDYVLVIRPDVAQAVLNLLLARARHYQARLQDMLRCAGDVFVSRWKKSANKRRNYLNANPLHIAVNKWPLFRYVFRNHKSAPLFGSYDETRNSMLLPWLSMEHMIDDPTNFLALVLHRSRSTMQDWTAFDTSQIDSAWRCGDFLELEYCNTNVIVRGDEYGKLTPWNAAQAHRGDTMGYPRARILIEAQDQLMEFLARTVESVLAHAPQRSTPATPSWPELASSISQDANKTHVWSKVSRQAYRASTSLNIDAFLQLARARLECAQDNAWLLQTDPHYMRAAVTALMESKCGLGYGAEVFGYVASHIATMAIGKIYSWKALLDECENVQVACLDHRLEASSGEDLPRSVHEALSCLRLMLEQCVDLQRKRVTTVVTRSKAFEHYFSLQRVETGDSILVENSHMVSAERTLLETDPLWLCISELLRPDKIFGRDSLFGFLDDLVSLDREQSGHVSRLGMEIVEELSDFAAMEGLLFQILHHRPIISSITPGDALKAGSCRPYWRCNGPFPIEPGRAPMLKIDPKTESSCISLKRFYERRMPSGSKDKTWLQKADSVRQWQKRFWEDSRVMFGRIFSRANMTESDIAAHLGLFSYDLETEQLEELTRERRMIENTVVRRSKTLPSSKIPEQTYSNQSGWLPSSPADGITANSRKRAKGKGRASTPVTEVDTLVDEVDSLTIETERPEEERTHVLIRVHKESYAVFKNMFPQANTKESSYNNGQTHWNSIVKAMADVDFEATSCSGSAVSFVNKEKKQSIIFHRPHPDPKISHVQLSWLGKRLTRRFGWDRESFVLI